MPSFFEFREKVTRPAKPASREQASGEPAPLTVSQITAQIDRAIKGGVPSHVWVKGEISNFKHHTGSGHIYFTLKDPDACIDCVMFRSDGAKLKFAPGDGMEMIAGGRVGVFAQRGRYQLYVSTLQPLGQGALELAFQQMRAKLEKEGLFAPDRKKPIPEFPTRIALVTSKETAALQDMLKVLRRFPWLRLFVYHVPVQGKGSAEKIASAIEHLNACHAQLGGVDVILLARGGGSLEDLWEFNEERVARAIAASRLPVVTGIGHEVDVSIADLVADYHAHTPTEAAQVVTAAWRSARDAVEGLELRLRRTIRQVVTDGRTRLSAIERHEAFRRPLDRVNRLRQLVDEQERALGQVITERIHRGHHRTQELALRLEQNRPSAIVVRMRTQLMEKARRLADSVSGRLRVANRSLSMVQARLRERHPRHAVFLSRTNLRNAETLLKRAIDKELERHRCDLEIVATHLRALSPEQVLKRGYSITTIKRSGAVVKSPTQVRPGDTILTRLADGEIESTVEDPNQGRLF